MGAPATGKGGKAMYGSVVIANIKEWSISGFSISPADITAFGDTIKKYTVADAGEPGTVSFSGNYDPADTAGQLALSTVCKAGTELTNLYLYANTSTYWGVAAGGAIIVTKADAVTLARSGVGTISFEGKVSGGAMTQTGTGA